MDDGSYADLFEEPDAYRQKPKPSTVAEYILVSGEALRVRLVGFSPLWGHELWNAARVAANFLEHKADSLIKGKDVLELGAGAGVPGIVCALHGARRVVITDYPDQNLIENLRSNVESCSLLAGEIADVHVKVGTPCGSGSFCLIAIRGTSGASPSHWIGTHRRLSIP